MSAYSTLYINRKEAIMKIIDELSIASDKSLEEVLDLLWANERLYNTCIREED